LCRTFPFNFFRSSPTYSVISSRYFQVKPALRVEDKSNKAEIQDYQILDDLLAEVPDNFALSPTASSIVAEEFDRSRKVIQIDMDNDLLGGIMPNSIHGFNDNAFLINDVCLYGSMIVFSNCYFLWRARTISDITIESLRIVELHYPTPSLLLVGTGEFTVSIDMEVCNYYLSKGIVIETSSTPTACATFNFMLQENRPAALAVLTRVLPEE